MQKFVLLTLALTCFVCDAFCVARVSEPIKEVCWELACGLVENIVLAGEAVVSTPYWLPKIVIGVAWIAAFEIKSRWFLGKELAFLT